MTEINDAYNELKSIQIMKRKIERVKEQINTLYSALDGLHSSIGGEKVQGGLNEKLESMLDNLNEKRLSHLEMVATLDHEISRISAKIDLIRFPNNEVLSRRFVMGERYEQIASGLSRLYHRRYSIDNVRHICQRGVIEYARL